MAIKTTRNITQPNTHTHTGTFWVCPSSSRGKSFARVRVRVASCRIAARASRCEIVTVFCHFYAHQPLYIGAHTCGDARCQHTSAQHKFKPYPNRHTHTATQNTAIEWRHRTRQQPSRWKGDHRTWIVYLSCQSTRMHVGIIMISAPGW